VLTVSLPIGLVFGALALGCRSLALSPARRRRWHAALLRLPGLSGLAWARAREQFARALQLLYHSGVAPGAAWTAAVDPEEAEPQPAVRDASTKRPARARRFS